MCKIVGNRQNEILFLKDYKWWDKDVDFLNKNFLLFHDIKKLIDTFIFLFWFFWDWTGFFLDWPGFFLAWPGRAKR